MSFNLLGRLETPSVLIEPPEQGRGAKQDLVEAAGVALPVGATDHRLTLLRYLTARVQRAVIPECSGDLARTCEQTSCDGGGGGS